MLLISSMTEVSTMETSGETTADQGQPGRKRAPRCRGPGARGEADGGNGSDGDPSVKILLVDDVEGIRFPLKMTLEESERSAVIGEAATGHEGIEAAKRMQPDLVLLGLSMPDMDGLEALPRILDVAPATKVAICSGFQADRLEATARRLGAIGYLEKGIEPDALVEALSQMLARASCPPPDHRTDRSRSPASS